MRWRMPTSVATMKVDAGESAARLTMPSVEVTTVAGPAMSPEDMRYIVDDVQPHSGWISSSASGCSRRIASRLSGTALVCSPERCVDKIGDVLVFGALVVVRQDHRVARVPQPLDPVQQLGPALCR